MISVKDVFGDGALVERIETVESRPLLILVEGCLILGSSGVGDGAVEQICS